VRLLLVDGHYYLYRSFYAIRDLHNSRGEPTNAIYGFAKALRKMVADVGAEFGAVVWDCGLPERRTTLQPAYKQQRKDMPDELRPQEKLLMELCPALGLPSLCLPNTEADDLIASYALAAVKAGWEVIIATNDKDILQLVGEGIWIYSTNKADLATPKDGFALLGADVVRAKWGVDPAQIRDVLALTGDVSDNIPGVPGIGGKTAAALIREHGSAPQLLEGLDAIGSEKLRAKLGAARPIIEQNLSMVSLDIDLSLPEPLEALRIKPDYDKLLAALRDCEFKSLLAEVEREAVAARAKPLQEQGELF
jgi:5'-3' exonuclease